jgi:hypothetical protein
MCTDWQMGKAPLHGGHGADGQRIWGLVPGVTVGLEGLDQSGVLGSKGEDTRGPVSGRFWQKCEYGVRGDDSAGAVLLGSILEDCGRNASRPNVCWEAPEGAEMSPPHVALTCAEIDGRGQSICGNVSPAIPPFGKRGMGVRPCRRHGHRQYTAHGQLARRRGMRCGACSGPRTITACVLAKLSSHGGCRRPRWPVC